MENNSFSNRLKAFMQYRKMSQTYLAQAMHIPFSTLNGYINGNREPSLEIVKDLSECLNCTLDYLLDVPAIPPYNPVAYMENKDSIIELISIDLSIDLLILKGWLNGQVFFGEEELKAISKLTSIPFSILIKSNPYIYLDNTFDNFILGLSELDDKQLHFLELSVNYEIAKRRYNTDKPKKHN